MHTHLKTAPIKDSVGQGSFAAALVSSLNIGSAIPHWNKLEMDPKKIMNY